MITEFTLSNEYGETYALNDLSAGLFTEPAGMGFSLSTNYTRLGTKWVPGEKKVSQTAVTGTIVFHGSDPYSLQTALLTFLRKSKKLIIHRTTSAGEYLKDVDLLSYDFGMVKESALNVKVKLMPKGLWYSTSVNRYVVTPGGNEREMRYSFRPSARFNDFSSGRLTFVNDGSSPAPFTMVINGAVIDPVITLIQDGVELYRLEIDAELTTGQTIEFSSIEDDLYCEMVSGTTRTNLVPGLDIANTNFFQIPVGTSIVKIEADTALVNPVVFTMYKQFLAV